MVQPYLRIGNRSQERIRPKILKVCTNALSLTCHSRNLIFLSVEHFWETAFQGGWQLPSWGTDLHARQRLLVKPLELGAAASNSAAGNSSSAHRLSQPLGPHLLSVSQWMSPKQACATPAALCRHGGNSWRQPQRLTEARKTPRNTGLSPGYFY